MRGADCPDHVALTLDSNWRQSGAWAALDEPDGLPAGSRALKRACRFGVPDELRARVWARLLDVEDAAAAQSAYDAQHAVRDTATDAASAADADARARVCVEALCEDGLPRTSQPQQLERRQHNDPQLLGVASVWLSPEGHRAAQRVVHAFSELYGVDYCPLLPRLAATLLLHLSEAQTFVALERMRERQMAQAARSAASTSVTGPHDQFLYTLEQEVAELRCMHTLLFRKSFGTRKSAARMAALGMLLVDATGSNGKGSSNGNAKDDNLPASESLLEWLELMRSLLGSVLPGPLHLLVVDCFLSEGRKALLRLALGAFQLHKRALRDGTESHKNHLQQNGFDSIRSASAWWQSMRDVLGGGSAGTLDGDRGDDGSGGGAGMTTTATAARMMLGRLSFAKKLSRSDMAQIEQQQRAAARAQVLYEQTRRAAASAPAPAAATSPSGVAEVEDTSRPNGFAGGPGARLLVLPAVPMSLAESLALGRPAASQSVLADGKHNASGQPVVTAESQLLGAIATSGSTNDAVLLSWLPVRLVPQTPRLVYSTEAHGRSLEALYARCALSPPGPMLLIMRALGDGARFGAFIGQRLHRTPHHYGDGESFVFTLSPVAKQYRWAQAPVSAVSTVAASAGDASDSLATSMNADNGAGAGLHVERNAEGPSPRFSEQTSNVSSANSIFVHSTASLLTVGGSTKSAAAALRIDSDLVRGFSERCDTYNNPPLCGTKPGALDGDAGEFEIAELEVFDFVVPR